MQLLMNSPFIEALEQHDLRSVRKVAKSDLHNHSMMGGRLRSLEKFYGKKLEPFRNGRRGVHGINEWLGNVYRPVFEKPGAFKAAVDAAFIQAKSDGVTLLEMSMDAFMGRLFNIQPLEVVSTFTESHRTIAPEIDFRPELGISRSLPVRTILSLIEPYLDLNFFRSVDLYDIEDAQPLENFREIYRLAKKTGFRCKAHAGEFGNADSVRETVEVLELDEVQHGIGAAGSPEVMKWLVQNRIRLNVCPASNIALKRARSYKTHPLRILFDHGVNVTVNTDDVMLFNAGNSEQFLRLYKSGLFSAEELDQIRGNGLRDPKIS
ncbi:MAG: adenosine deaminase [Bacteroidetes bacterium]|nr:adenosine deaminase [Bacteroidota bacterium]